MLRESVKICMTDPPIWTSIVGAMLVAVSLTLSGCYHLEFRADTRRECPGNGGINWKTKERFDPETARRPSISPIVKVVEFTDGGELRDRCQWSDVLYEIRGNPPSRDLFDRPKFVVIYVHGWKHDSSSDDGDLQHFTELIQQLTEAQDKGITRSDVIGVYVAWPGVSTKVPVIENLSFWGRKGASDRVAVAGNFSKLLSAIASIRRQRRNANDFIVGIGHSFGARILFSAASPLLIHEFQMHHPGYSGGRYGAFSGPIDLTVLLNPAFEASRYTAIDSSRRWQESFANTQQPVLLSVSTANDNATKFAFPVGQFIGTRWGERERTTLGNYTEYVTHGLHHSHAPEKDGKRGYMWYDNYCKETLCLERIANDLQPGNPFIVATTDEKVLNGHNGIWKISFQQWLVAFIQKTKIEQRK